MGSWYQNPRGRWCWDPQAPDGAAAPLEAPVTDTPDAGPGRGYELLSYDADDPLDPTAPEQPSPLPEPAPERVPEPGGLMVCPTCGSGVAPDRLRE